MTQDLNVTPATGIDYSSLGLIGNPLAIDARRRRYGMGFGLMTNAMVHETLARMAAMATTDAPRPILIEKGAGYSSSWHQRATASFLHLATQNRYTDVLIVYVPVELFRLGRVRGALSATAERVAFLHFQDNLIAYAADAFGEPDTGLAEWGALSELVDVDELRARFEDDPGGLLDEVLGEQILVRDEDMDPKRFMHITALRENRLHPDPDEDDDSEEFDAEDPYADAFMVPASEMPTGTLVEQREAAQAELDGDDGAASLEASADEAAASSAPDEEAIALAIGDYLIAYIRAHLSPVVARGLRAYRAQGIASMLQEWKVTKAPKKTLKALVTFARRSYGRVCLVYDHFEHLLLMPDDVKEVILGTIAELKIALRENGMVMAIRLDGDAEELTSVLGDALRIPWDYPESARLTTEDFTWGPEDVQRWLDAAALEGHDAPRVDSEPFKQIFAEADGDLARLADIAEVALRDAAKRGLSDIDGEAVAAGLRASDEPTEGDGEDS